ncbi:hypothetical protein L2E82_23026 [Cichorium intybus]|uniref:Uncharacterized protein n=1 Tax=Cichorium intybus TaxID=13427 RepID=A0ACB9E0C8_CICIN|nr:hypothetical protein L2E82_23026 [Cichorium intybus]
MLRLKSTSIPNPSHFFSFHIVSGKINRCKVASVARSNADAKLFFGRPGDNVCGSFPKAKPLYLRAAVLRWNNHVSPFKSSKSPNWTQIVWIWCEEDFNFGANKTDRFLNLKLCR